MSRTLVTALATLVLGAAAQVPARAAEALTPAMFVTRASEGGLAEVETGRLAAQKGSTTPVKQFGERLVMDHGKANAELRKLAMAKDLMPAGSPNAAQQKALDDLRTRNGKDFDDAFARQMLKDHDEDIALFQAATMLQDAELAAFASRTLPTLREHREMAAHLGARH